MRVLPPPPLGGACLSSLPAFATAQRLRSFGSFGAAACLRIHRGRRSH